MYLLILLLTYPLDHLLLVFLEDLSYTFTVDIDKGCKMYRLPQERIESLQ